MHVVQSKHHLVDDVGGLTLSEARDLGEALEKFTASNKLRNNIITFMIFHEIDNSDDVGVRLLTEDGQFVLEQLYVNLLLLDGLLLHDLDGKSLTTALVHAQTDHSERTLAQCFAEYVSILDIPHFLELFVIINVESPLFNNFHSIFDFSL